MRINGFLSDLWQNERPLMASGFGFVILFVIFAAVSLVDSTQILGINRWIKPMKFSISIAVYLWTLAGYLYFLRGRETASRVIGWGAAAMLVGEIILITMQAARGTTSHFNLATRFDGAVFSLMGMMIVVNTALIVYLTYLYFRERFELPKAVLWGMRFGLIVFLLASVEGGYMSAQIGHSVGVKDGGAGLPFVNWSSEGGDLRVAHFIGMHALQAIPLFALMLVWIEKRFTAVNATALTVSFSVIYAAATALTFYQAAIGQPLLGKQITVTRKAAAGEETVK